MQFCSFAWAVLGYKKFVYECGVSQILSGSWTGCLLACISYSQIGMFESVSMVALSMKLVLGPYDTFVQVVQLP